MKKVFQGIVLSALAVSFASGSALAQEKIAPISEKLLPAQAQFPARVANGKGNATKVQAVSFKILDSLQNAFSLYSTDQKPFIWESTKNRLVLIKRGAKPNEGGELNNLDNLFILTSDNMGQTWKTPIGPVDGKGSADIGNTRYPSVLGIPEGAEHMAYPFVSALVNNSSSGWGNLGYGVVLDNDPDNTYAVSSAGAVKDGKTYTWGAGAMMAKNADNSTIFVVGPLSAPTGSPSSENNSLGLMTIDFKNFDGKTSIPPQWTSEKFADPSSASSRTSTLAGIEYHAGSLYVGVFGRFISSEDASSPTVAVSASSDNGKTWSEFDILPRSVIASYVAQRDASATIDSVTFTFNTAVDFVVTGNGSFSFVTNLIDQRAIPYNQQLHDLVEIYKENGAWGIRTIARVDMAARIPMRLFANQLSEPNPDSTSTNQRGNEAQVAKTLDGTKLVVKYLDYAGGLIFDTSLPADFGDGVAPDTVNSTDIFISARSIGSDKWTTTPINITNDNFIDKITWIPPVVPNDLRNIPLLTVQSMTSRPAELTAQQAMDELRIISIPQYIMFGTFDASVAVGVHDNNAEQTGLLLDNVYPNPVGDLASVSFTLPSAGYAVLELHNALGQKVLSLVDGYRAAGQQNIEMDTRSLSAGTYYYTLKWNGKTETRTLSIVR